MDTPTQREPRLMPVPSSQHPGERLSDSVRQRLSAQGLTVLGPCTGLSAAPCFTVNESPLLENFTPAQADVLGSFMTMVAAQPGQMLIREGQSDDWMLLLLSGSVDVQKNSPDGPTRLAVVRAGAVLGEMSMLDGEPRYASCVALEPVQTALLTRAAVGHLIEEHPAIGAKLLVKITQLLAQRLRNTSNQVVKLADQRVAAAASATFSGAPQRPPETSSKANVT